MNVISSSWCKRRDWWWQ